MIVDCFMSMKNIEVASKPNKYENYTMYITPKCDRQRWGTARPAVAVGDTGKSGNHLLIFIASLPPKNVLIPYLMHQFDPKAFLVLTLLIGKVISFYKLLWIKDGDRTCSYWPWLLLYWIVMLSWLIKLLDINDEKRVSDLIHMSS